MDLLTKDHGWDLGIKGWDYGICWDYLDVMPCPVSRMIPSLFHSRYHRDVSLAFLAIPETPDVRETTLK